MQLHILHYFLRNLKNSSLKQQWAVPPTKTIMCKSEILCCCSCNFITTSKVIAIFRSKIVLFPTVWHSELRKVSHEWFSLGTFDYNRTSKSYDPLGFNSSHWLKLQRSDWSRNIVKDFYLQINLPPMRAIKFVGHVIFQLH